MSNVSYNSLEKLAKKLQVVIENNQRLSKDKKITFRVTKEMYEELETMAKLSGTNMSRVMEAITKEQLQLLKPDCETEEVEECMRL